MKFSELAAAADRSDIEKWCQHRTIHAYLGDHVMQCRVLGNYKLYVDTRDLSLAPHLIDSGYWEMWVTQAICSYVKPGMRCVDVGANFGYYTVLLSELVGEKGSVVAYEPSLDLVKLLKRTLIVNGFGQAQVLPRAASDHSGFEKFYVAPGYTGSGALKEFEGAVSVGFDGKVCLSRPDDDLHSWPSVDFVKIDAQGHELQVLAGMKALIERSPKLAVAMEFTPSEHPDPGEALAGLERLGFGVKTIGTDGVVRAISREEAQKAETGDHRMLWLQKG
jgi:FkbM family methyltransferase